MPYNYTPLAPLKRGIHFVMTLSEALIKRKEHYFFLLLIILPGLPTTTA